MVEYTPGPWRIDPDDEWAGKHPYHDNRFITAHDVIIAKMTDGPNQLADARLIAAAPELLEALYLYVQMDSRHHANIRLRGKDWAECHQAALVALAKAHGLTV